MKRLAIIFGATLTVFSMGAFAGNADEGEIHTHVPEFETLNQDMDNHISREEFINADERPDVDFTALDMDGDNQINKEEYFSYFRDDWEEDPMLAE